MEELIGLRNADRESMAMILAGTEELLLRKPTAILKKHAVSRYGRPLIIYTIFVDDRPVMDVLFGSGPVRIHGYENNLPIDKPTIVAYEPVDALYGIIETLKGVT